MRTLIKKFFMLDEYKKRLVKNNDKNKEIIIKIFSINGMYSKKWTKENLGKFLKSLVEKMEKNSSQNDDDKKFVSEIAHNLKITENSVEKLIQEVIFELKEVHDNERSKVFLFIENF